MRQSTAKLITMKDGFYELRLTVDDYSGLGTLVFDGTRGQGYDGTFQVEVHLIGGGNEVAGVANVLLRPDASTHLAIPEHYSLRMLGSAGDEAFNLIGRAPSGQLVEISADRSDREAAQDRRQVDRR